MRSIVLASVALFAVACAEAPVDGDPPTAPGPVAVDCAVTPYASSCEKKVSTTTTTTTPKPAVDPTTSADHLCAAKTCEDYKGACGQHDDGCGKSFSCGECKAPAADCKPTTCEKLNVTCGSHEDGCGGTVSCGTCATTCATDSKEPNDTMAQAVDLGAAADTEDKTMTTTNLATADGDEDWFKVKVSDKGFGSNPTIQATATDAKLEVTAFHVCNSLPNYSYCYAEGTQDNAVGNGCHAMGTVTLKTDCSGIDESGTTYIRVRKNVSDLSCHSYDLKVLVY